VRVYICDEEGEKVVMLKGDIILVLVGFVHIVSMMRDMTVLAAMDPDCAIFVKLIW